MHYEIGECSHSDSAKDVDCGIPGVERFDIPGCRHAFCVGCARQYISARAKENLLAIGCPDPGPGVQGRRTPPGGVPARDPVTAVPPVGRRAPQHGARGDQVLMSLPANGYSAPSVRSPGTTASSAPSSSGLGTTIAGGRTCC